MALTKKHIIREVNELGYNWRDSAEIAEAILEIMKKSLEDGEDVLVSGFGKFVVQEKEPKSVRSFATGESMRLDARNVVSYRCSGKLKEKINNGQ